MSTCYQKTLRHSVSSAWYNWDVYFGELKDRIRQPFSKLTLFLCKEKDFHSSLLTGFDDEVHILIFSIFFKQKYFLENDVLQNSKYGLNQTWQNPWNIPVKMFVSRKFSDFFPQIYWKTNSFTVTFVQRFCKIWLVRFNSISGCFFKILYFK